MNTNACLPNSRATKKPRKAALSRAQLLSRLRADSARLGCGPVDLAGPSLLADLARTAKNCTRGSVVWRGIRFPLLCGWALMVMDPEHHKPLVSVPGGFLC
jgi:hypothetical protein